jgi:type IV pilus assembly protein PilC
VQIEDALKAADFITPSSAYILKLGFRAGKGDELISEIANQAQLDVSNEINAKLSRIEPALVVSASVITGIILLTVMLPLLDIMNTIG